MENLKEKKDIVVDYEYLWKMGYEAIRSLETESGVLASSRNEKFGCIFGRDSLIISLLLMSVYEKVPDVYFLNLSKKVLLNLALLQGKDENIESGEEPGKIIHEYRPTNHEHLTAKSERPWYVYPDGQMRIYDSLDSTPLFLIAVYRYYQHSRDEEFLNTILPSVEFSLEWMIEYSDSKSDEDIFSDYFFPSERRHGGLVNQSWMDSKDSVFHEDGADVPHPINPVEVQAYVYLAYRLWSKYFEHLNVERSAIYASKAESLKKSFNEKFVQGNTQELFISSAIDGIGKPLISVRSSMGHCLWASMVTSVDGVTESIIDDLHVHDIVERLLKPDLFIPEVGIRTLSSKSSRYEPNSYHNGSVWPHDNAILAEGFARLGYELEAHDVYEGIAKSITYFKTPLELFVFDEDYKKYENDKGGGACMTQGWSAAAVLLAVSFLKNFEEKSSE